MNGPRAGDPTPLTDEQRRLHVRFGEVLAQTAARFCGVRTHADAAAVWTEIDALVDDQIAMRAGHPPGSEMHERPDVLEGAESWVRPE